MEIWENETLLLSGYYTSYVIAIVCAFAFIWQESIVKKIGDYGWSRSTEEWPMISDA